MFVFFEIRAIKTFLLGIPESIGLLLFGLGLVAATMLLRWFFARAEAVNADDKFDEKVTR